MKALILVGGYGTRMRPLTVTCPKSVLPFINKPMVEFQVQALVKVGVKQIILAINYLGEIIKKDLAYLQQKYKVKMIYSQQPQALGTAGPIKYCENILKQNNESGMFFVFNSDIICDFPLQQLISIHKTHKKQATIVLATVQDPSRFGVVVTSEQQNGIKVQRFVQKPQQFISNKINAGIYLLNFSVMDRIPTNQFCMIQKKVFPSLATDGELYALALPNKFWFDLGKPEDYLKGQHAYLEYYKKTSQHAKGNCLIDPSSTIGAGTQIGPNVVIGSNCKIGIGCKLSNCAIFHGSQIGPGCYIANSVVSWKCKIGGWTHIQKMTCIAEECKIQENSRLEGCNVLSFKNVAGSHSGHVLM